jgi:hypothetical protein
MKLKNIIKDTLSHETPKESQHINELQNMILAKVHEEQTHEEEIKSFFSLKRFSWNFQLPLAFALVLVIVVCSLITLNTPVSAKGSFLDNLIALKNQIQQELTHLLGNDPSYRDKSTQKYKQAQQEWCTVSARAPEEQEKAVDAIQDFLDRPDANVKYECIRNPESRSSEQAQTESYLVDFDRFTIDTKTNTILEMSPKEGAWGENKDGSHWSSPEKEYDYTSRYTQAQAEQLARDFIKGHEKALGKIDLSSLTLESSLKGEDIGKVNYFFTWIGKPQTKKIAEPYKTCSKDIKKEDADSYDNNGVPCITATEDKFTPQLTISFTQGGQLVQFSKITSKKQNLTFTKSFVKICVWK